LSPADPEPAPSAHSLTQQHRDGAQILSRQQLRRRGPGARRVRFVFWLPDVETTGLARLLIRSRRGQHGRLRPGISRRAEPAL